MLSACKFYSMLKPLRAAAPTVQLQCVVLLAITIMLCSEAHSGSAAPAAHGKLWLKSPDATITLGPVGPKISSAGDGNLAISGPLILHGMNISAIVKSLVDRVNDLEAANSALQERVTALENSTSEMTVDVMALKKNVSNSQTKGVKFHFTGAYSVGNRAWSDGVIAGNRPFEYTISPSGLELVFQEAGHYYIHNEIINVYTDNCAGCHDTSVGHRVTLACPTAGGGIDEIGAAMLNNANALFKSGGSTGFTHVVEAGCALTITQYGPGVTAVTFEVLAVKLGM